MLAHLDRLAELVGFAQLLRLDEVAFQPLLVGAGLSLAVELRFVLSFGQGVPSWLALAQLWLFSQLFALSLAEGESILVVDVLSRLRGQLRRLRPPKLRRLWTRVVAADFQRH